MENIKSLVPKRQRIQPGIDLSDDIIQTMKSVENQIELRETEYLAAEAGTELPNPEEWKRGLIYMRKKKSLLNQSISRRIGYSIKVGIASFSRKAPGSRRSNSSNVIEDVVERQLSNSVTPPVPVIRPSASWYCCCGCYFVRRGRLVLAAGDYKDENSISNHSSVRARANLANFRDPDYSADELSVPNLQHELSLSLAADPEPHSHSGGLLNFLSPQRLFEQRKQRYVDT